MFVDMSIVRFNLIIEEAILSIEAYWVNSRYR
jgi:hypothetical protein